MKGSHASRWLIVCLILGGLAGRIVTGLLVYTRLAYLGILILVGAATWTILSISGLCLRRNSRSLRASVGDLYEEHYEIKKETWPGCPWLEVINQSNLPQAAGSRLFTRIVNRHLLYFSARTILTKRGAFLLGPTTLTTGDPFGIFTVTKTFPSRNILVILPMAFPILTFASPVGLLPGGKAIRQRTSEVTPHAAEVREYVPGDPMKRIHWPSTAHRGQLMVKEFEQDPQADIWLFLDAYRPVHLSIPGPENHYQFDNIWIRRPKIPLPKDTFEYAISITASLASYFLTDRRSVGLACAAGKFNIVSGERGERQINKIMETLAFLQPEGIIPLPGLVNLQAKLLPLGSGVIIITPSAHPDLLLAVEDLQRRKLRPVVVLIRSETFGGPEGSEKMGDNLLSLNVPVCLIGLGDNLGEKLAMPTEYFQHSNLRKAYS
jgi:uncharacterized protein (DUF58 family)